MASPRSDDKAHQSGEAAQEAARRMTEETARTARANADAGERAARAGAELFQHNADSMQRAWQAGIEAAAHLTERSASQFARVFGLSGEEAQKATKQSSQNVEAIMQSTSAVAQAWEGISREMLDQMRRGFEQSLGQMDALMRCRTPQDFLTLQSSAVRDNLEGFLQTSRRIAEVSMRTADDASRKMTENMERMRRAA